MTNTLATCVGWLFDISIENDKAIIWIKTEDKKILKLRDSYKTSFYILPRNESDGLQLLRTSKLIFFLACLRRCEVCILCILCYFEMICKNRREIIIQNSK